MKKSLPWVVVGFVVLVLVVAFGRRIVDAKERSAAAKAATGQEVITAVTTATIERKDLPQVLQITGSVKAMNEVQVLPKSPGRVTAVRFEVGAVVKAGDVLALVEAIDMALRVQLATAQRQVAAAGLEQARVQQGAALRAFERAQNLKDKGSLSQIDFEQAENGHRLADVGVMGAAAQVALADANLALVQKAFEDTRITTPIAGIITKKIVNVGTFANPAAPAFWVQDQSSLRLEGTVPAAYVAQIKSGMKVQVLVDELEGRVFDGTVSRIAPTLEPETRRGAIEVSLAPAKDLLPYMFGHALIAFGNTKDVVVVPSSAVVSVAGLPGVYIVKNAKAELVRPRLGPKHDNDFVVEEGLVVGDTVVISGDAGVKDGGTVAVSGS